MIVSESRPMDSKEAAQEKEMDPLPLLRNGVLDLEHLTNKFLAKNV
jgi:hypothetical protein